MDHDPLAALPIVTREVEKPPVMELHAPAPTHQEEKTADQVFTSHPPDLAVLLGVTGGISLVREMIIESVGPADDPDRDPRPPGPKGNRKKEEEEEDQ